MRRIWPKTRPLNGVAGAALITALSLGVSVVGTGCDTTAFISPQDRPLTSVTSSGVVTAAVCDEPSGTTFRMSFNVLDSDRRIFASGDRAGSAGNRAELIYGDSFQENDNLQLRSPRIYPQPDIPCTEDADCAAAGLSGDFVCTSVNPTGPIEGGTGQAGGNAQIFNQVCAHVPSSPVLSFEQRSLSFQPEEPLVQQPQIVVVGVVNGRSLHGFAPGAERETASFRADPLQQRTQGVRNLVRELYRSNAALTRAPADNLVDDSRVCIALFEGDEGDPPTFLDSEGVTQNCFFAPQNLPATETTVARVGDLPGAIDQELQLRVRTTVREGNRNVWYSAVRLLQRAQDGRAQTPEGATAPIHLVLFTDGPDNGGGEGFEQPATRDSLIAAAQQAGASVHIVHLDNPGNYDGEGKPYFGPNEDFAQVACATGGTYQYTRTPGGIAPSLEAVGQVATRRAEVDLEIPALGRTGIPRGPYLLGGVLEASFAGNTVTVEFGGRVTQGGEDFDRRIPIFKFSGEARPDPTVVPTETTGEVGQTTAAPTASEPTEETPVPTTPPATNGGEEQGSGEQEAGDDA